MPDFNKPPLNEVVLGVQFSTPKNYQQILAGKVWDLYKEEFPLVQEQAPLAPSFETFGISHQRVVQPQILFGSGGSHDRFWFLKPKGNELIQFQQDRFLHNWRKTDDSEDVYPRFETMIGRLQSQLQQFEGFIETLATQSLNINQAEISYINHILIDESSKDSISSWLNFVQFDKSAPEDFSLSMRDVVRNPDGTPIARVTCEASTGLLPSGGKVLVFSLTVRGAPAGNKIDSALRFLNMGRDVIVLKFAGLTTEKAHKLWERTK